MILLDTLERALSRDLPMGVHLVQTGGRPPRGSQSFALPRLMLTLQGRHRFEASSTTGATTIDCRSGEAIYTAPQAWTRPIWRTRHRFFALVCHQGFTRYLRFHTDEEGGVIDTSKVWFHTPQPTSGALAECLRCLRVCATRRTAVSDPAHCDLARAALRLACDELREADQPIDPAAEQMRHLRAWLDDHIHKDCTRAQAAAEIGVHPNHLSRLVRQQADCRWVDLLAETRLQRAAGYLAHSDLKVGEIAEKLGFGSSTWLIRRFRRRFGITPGCYRRDIGT